MIAKIATKQSTRSAYSEPSSIFPCSKIQIARYKIVATLASIFTGRSVVFSHGDHAEMSGANAKAIPADMIDDETGINGTVMSELVTKAMCSFIASPSIPVIPATRDCDLTISRMRATGCPLPSPALRFFSNAGPEAPNGFFIIHGSHYDKETRQTSQVLTFSLV